ncbi:hypothetical protein [Micromonospora thermarum]|nr:hypothetical protein [Micromonospora thermarum]
MAWAPGSIVAILAGGEPTDADADAEADLGQREAVTAAPPAPRDEEVEIVLADDSLDNEMKMEIIELIYERRQRDRAASMEETRRMIDMFRRRLSA